jgi:hypothetical protein
VKVRANSAARVINGDWCRANARHEDAAAKTRWSWQKCSLADGTIRRKTTWRKCEYRAWLSKAARIEGSFQFRPWIEPTHKTNGPVDVFLVGRNCIRKQLVHRVIKAMTLKGPLLHLGRPQSGCLSRTGRYFLEPELSITKIVSRGLKLAVGATGGVTKPNR